MLTPILKVIWSLIMTKGEVVNVDIMSINLSDFVPTRQLSSWQLRLRFSLSARMVPRNQNFPPYGGIFLPIFLPIFYSSNVKVAPPIFLFPPIVRCNLDIFCNAILAGDSFRNVIR